MIKYYSILISKKISQKNRNFGMILKLVFQEDLSLPQEILKAF